MLRFICKHWKIGNSPVFANTLLLCAPLLPEPSLINTAVSKLKLFSLW